MADEKTTPMEELKWWIERGPVKEREKKAEPQQGLIEQWAYELLKDYNQDRALQSVVDINQRVFKEFSVPPGEWGYLSLGVGRYPVEKLARIKEMLRFPSHARALVIDAGYSVRVLISGEPMGERYIDINFTEVPSLDYWVKGELVEEKLFSNFDEALRKLRPSLHSYLSRSDLI
ncbi:MAG: hypothetical protein ACE5FB_03000 [Candidatus Binatia bacterium]